MSCGQEVALVVLGGAPVWPLAARTQTRRMREIGVGISLTFRGTGSPAARTDYARPSGRQIAAQSDQPCPMHRKPRSTGAAPPVGCRAIPAWSAHPRVFL